MDPITGALLAAGASAAGSVFGGALSNRKPKETKLQKQKRSVIDQILASIQGNGAYSDLFSMDEAGFQRSFVDPAKARFKNQIAPQIQQSFIAGGQQRGTGLDDTLTRAGVDMDQLLNEQYMNYQQGALNRQSSALSGILGGGDGVQPGISSSQAAREGGAGFLAGDSFSSLIDEILKRGTGSSNQNQNQPLQAREGYAL